MKRFLNDLWFDEPVALFGILSTALTAYVGFGDPPDWAIITALVVTALAGFYGRSITQPYRVDKLSDPVLVVPEAVVADEIPVGLDVQGTGLDPVDITIEPAEPPEHP